MDKPADRPMDTSFFTAWIDAIAETVDREAGRLSRLDAAIGDGDHGTNLRRGFTAAVAAVREGAPETPGAVLVTTGRALISKVGGAAGPLYGGALRRAGKALGDRREVDAAALGEALRAAVEAVQKLGQAEKGDKTMVDAMLPAIAAYDSAIADGSDLTAATRMAALAARAGADATVPLQARKGRASYLGERSIGHEDPGAASTALILATLADVAAARG
jgi:dihydroxyacetone kinase phosphoprotein-dependent L subunit